MVDLAGSERQAKTGAKVWIKVFVKRGNVNKNGNDKIKFKMIIMQMSYLDIFWFFLDEMIKWN